MPLESWAIGVQALKERHHVSATESITHFQCSPTLGSSVPGATCFAALSTCPWLLQFAPLALQLLHFQIEFTILLFLLNCYKLYFGNLMALAVI